MGYFGLRLNQTDQKVGWLELFYDLVYVASIISLASWFSHHLTIEGIGGFVLVFTLMWSSWVGTVFFINRFDQKDIGQRFLILLQMYLVVGLAVHMRDPFGESARGFALLYSLVILVRIVLYLRAKESYPSEWPLIKYYISGDIPLLLIFLFSIFLSSTIRIPLWIAGVLWGMSVPFLPQMRKWGEIFRPDMHHLSERVGLFTIIVLGESFIKAVSSSLEIEHVTFGIFGAFGMIVVASLWWVYFDHIDSAEIKEDSSTRFIWFMAHLPLAMAIIVTGVTISKIVAKAKDHSIFTNESFWLLGSLAFYWLIMALNEGIVDGFSSERFRRLGLTRIAGFFALIIASIFRITQNPSMVLIFAALICSGLVVIEVYYRVSQYKAINQN